MKCWQGGSSSKSVEGRTSLIYTSGEQAAADEATRAWNELRDPRPTPKAGYLGFIVERPTIDLANPANQLVVVESGGQQVLRLEPERGIPDPPSGGMLPYWRSVVVAQLPDEGVLPLTVHLADKIRSTRCTGRSTRPVASRSDG